MAHFGAVLIFVSRSFTPRPGSDWVLNLKVVILLAASSMLISPQSLASDLGSSCASHLKPAFMGMRLALQSGVVAAGDFVHSRLERLSGPKQTTFTSDKKFNVYRIVVGPYFPYEEAAVYLGARSRILEQIGKMERTPLEAKPKSSQGPSYTSEDFILLIYLLNRVRSVLAPEVWFSLGRSWRRSAALSSTMNFDNDSLDSPDLICTTGRAFREFRQFAVELKARAPRGTSFDGDELASIVIDTQTSFNVAEIPKMNLDLKIYRIAYRGAYFSYNQMEKRYRPVADLFQKIMIALIDHLQKKDAGSLSSIEVMRKVIAENSACDGRL